MWGSTKASVGADRSEGATRRNFLRASSAFGLAMAATAGATSSLVGWTAAQARALVGIGPTMRSPTTPDPLTFGTKPVMLTEGTNISAAVSPDSKWVTFDLMGVIWVQPLAGGQPKQLTSYLMDSARPRWSPDGKLIVFQAYRDGNYHIWVVQPDGKGLRQLTTGFYDDREPQISPDGKTVAFASERAGGKYGLYVVDVAGGAPRAIGAPTTDEAEPAWSPDGRALAFTTKGGIGVRNLDGSLKSAPVGSTVRESAWTPEGKARELSAEDGARAQAPAWTPDGQLAYAVVAGSAVAIHVAGRAVTDATEDVFPFGVTWISPEEFLYTADGHIKRRMLSGGPAKIVPFKARLMVKPPTDYVRKTRDFDSTAPRPVKGICEPALSPDGGKVAFCALDQVWVLTVGSETPVRLTNDASAKCAPAWSPDGRSLAYASDRTGVYELWVHDLAGGAERQLTAMVDSTQWPAWSPDGSQIAFLNRVGGLCTVSLADGAVRVLFPGPERAGRPSWSPDGKTLVMPGFKAFSGRFREGVSVLLTVDAASGKRTHSYVDPDDLSLGIDGRERNGPAWSPDGAWLAFAMAGFLWALPVNAKGLATGKLVQLTDELSETPSWSADSRYILYQSGTHLRRIAVGGGAPETIPLKLGWQMTAPKPGRTVIHAGRLWNGRSDDVATDMDVVIEGSRIVAVEKHRARDGVKWIDASGLTVMPGLIDMHVHTFNDGLREALSFLTFGVTTIRCLGGDAYRHAHAIETIHPGVDPFPRYFGTGENIDGMRGGVRSVRNLQQLELELSRAKTFDYDLIKTYVRMPPEMQKRSVEFAHSMQVPSTSHNLFPGVAFGQDGKEHLYGTDRLGYNRGITLSGRSYQDVVEIQAASGAARTPTLFGLTLMPEHKELLNDPRLTVVMPAWIHTTLKSALQGDLVDRFAVRSSGMANQVATLKAMLASKAIVVTGTDDPIYPPGIALHNNLWYMSRFGMKPADIMRSATSVSGDYLGQGVGAIEPGKFADIIAVEGNPLQRVEDTFKVKIAMVAGKAWTQEEMVAMLAGKSGAAAST